MISPDPGPVSSIGGWACTHKRSSASAWFDR